MQRIGKGCRGKRQRCLARFGGGGLRQVQLHKKIITDMMRCLDNVLQDFSDRATWSHNPPTSSLFEAPARVAVLDDVAAPSESLMRG
jgi:hypothetical protein